MKRRPPIVFQLFLLLVATVLFLANSGNPNNGNTGAPGEGTCQSCHNTPPANVNGNITLSGLPATVMPGNTYTLTLTSNVTSGSPLTAGFQMVSLNSSLQNAGDMQEISADVGTDIGGSGREYVEHRGDKPISGNMVSWTFEWTAPVSAPGSGLLTFYATSILANNNGSNSNDRMIQNTFTTTLSGGGPPLSVSISSSSNVSCFGGNDGSATATATGGTPPITYSWSNGQNGPTATNLPVGFYTVTATDDIGQTATANVIISQPSILGLQLVSQTNVDCFGNSTGQAVVSASGGTPGYTYNWSNGTSGPFASNLAAGPYQVTVTDNNQCTASTTVVITQPNPLNVSIVSQTNVDCNGNSTGSLTVNPSGGTPPYQFQWSNGPTGPTNSGIPAGSYTVTITDANGCTAGLTATITQPATLIATVGSQTDPSCAGGADGTAVINVNGGVPPYVYEWSNGDSGPGQNDLSAGNYTVTVTDDNACESTVSFTLNDPAGMNLSAVIQDVSCGDNCDGAINLSVSGGSSPYTFSWSTGANTEDLANLCIGGYTVTVTDNNGCTATGSYQVGGVTALDLSILNQTNVDCNGNSTGSVTVGATGGTMPYEFSWSTGDTGPTLSNLAAGNYGVTVTDANMCTDFLLVMITQPTVLVANTSATNETGNGANDGTATASPTGGTTPYSYEWNTGATTAMITDLAPGTYTVTVTDANNCTSIESVTVNPFSCNLGLSVSTQAVSCFGGSDGSATANASGGVEPLSYSWSSGGDMMTENGLSAGSYSVTVTDAANCSVIANFQIGQPTALALSVDNLQNVSCNGGSDGQAEVLVSGGTPDYTILWPGGQTTFLVQGLEAGNYQPMVTDANGCIASITVTISEPDPLAANLGSTDETAYESNDGTAFTSPSGGTPPYFPVWETGAESDTITGLSPGFYTVTLTDSQGCQLVDSVEVSAFPCTLMADISGMNLSCNGSADGTATAVAIDGDGPYSFEWSNGESTQSICELPAGTYDVTITDANGCPATNSITLTEPDELVISVDAITDVSCNGDTDGSASVSSTGGTPSVEFQWTDPNGNELTGPDQTGLIPGNYMVLATDANGCTAMTVLEIGEPDLLEVSLSGTNETSNGANDGTATATPAGGTSPYTYQWSNGGDTQTITGLSPDTYSVTVTDANGCTVTGVISINPFNCNLDVSLVIGNVSCNGSADGQLSAQISDSNDPPMIESIDWSNGESGTNQITGLAPGMYTVTVVNTDGCVVVESATISQPPVFSATASAITDVACFGEATGSVQINPTGGTSPYTVSFLGNTAMLEAGETLAIADLPAGNYTANLTDANGCGFQVSFTIGQPDPLSVEVLEVTGVECPGDSNGAASLGGLGGVMTYSFAWSDGGSGPGRMDLTNGTYTVTITDGNACTATTTVEIPVLDSEPPSVSVAPLTVYLDETGVAVFEASDFDTGTMDNCGLASISIDINMLDCSNLSDPEVPVVFTATDVSGNVATVTTIVTVQDTILPELLLPADTTITNCDGLFFYSVEASDNCLASLPALESGPASGSNFPLGTTTVIWSVGDPNTGTNVVDSFTVTVANTLMASIPIQSNSCPDDMTGSATVIASGGTPPFSYLWDDPDAQTTETADGLAAGDYSVTVADDAGCETVAIVSIGAFTAMEVSDPVVVDESDGNANGSINIDVTAGDGPFLYEWYKNGALFSDQEDLSGLSAGEYLLILYDANGCSLEVGPLQVENLTGVGQIDAESGILVYPVPAFDAVWIELQFSSSEDILPELFDLSGKKLPVSGSWIDQHRFRMETGQLASGVYMIRLRVDNRQLVQRIIVQ